MRPPRQPKPPAEDEPDWKQEYLDCHEEMTQMVRLIESLSKSDRAQEIVVLTGKVAALNGRLHQVLETEKEAIKTAKYRGDLLSKIRKELGVESNGEIIQAIRNLKA